MTFKDGVGGAALGGVGFSTLPTPPGAMRLELGSPDVRTLRPRTSRVLVLGGVIGPTARTPR